MNQNRQFVNIVADETTSWQPDYSEVDLNNLIDDGWVPMDRTNDDGTIEHRLYNPEPGFIRYIKWIDKKERVVEKKEE